MSRLKDDPVPGAGCCRDRAPAVAFRGGTADKATTGIAARNPPVSCRGDARHEPFFRRTRFLRQHEACDFRQPADRASADADGRSRPGGGGMIDGIPTAAAEAPARLCPVCAAEAEDFQSVDKRVYLRCPDCHVRFLDPAHHPTRAEEHANYLRHENHPEDPAYRRFLSRLADPLLKRLAPASQGLDYGCGPGPALAAMLREAGHEVALHDPFFEPDPAPLDDTYDFVTCTEAAEHFHRPAEDFARLRRLVRPGGWLALMTCFQTDDARFAAWHYRHDPTHVIFYREETFRRLAHTWRWTVEIPAKDVVLMRRPMEAQG